MCAEGLSCLISHFATKGDIGGLGITRGGQRWSHLLLADDCLLFCRASLTEWEQVSQLLSQYKKALGQTLNLQKTSIFFSKNTSFEVKNPIVQ